MKDFLEFKFSGRPNPTIIWNFTFHDFKANLNTFLNIHRHTLGLLQNNYCIENKKASKEKKTGDKLGEQFFF